MEAISLTVSAIVAALATKAGDRAVEATVHRGEGVLRRVVSRLRARFVDTGDQAATEALELVERVPDSAALAAGLAGHVDRHMRADAGFAGELEQLVGQARAEGVNVDEIRQVACGDGNVQIADVTDSQISIGQPPLPPRPPST